jgi:predicted tellurium resistance membrane protein TerC
MDALRHLTDFSWTAHPSAWIGLITLIALEIVLGIDNIVFISILSGKLPENERARGRKMGMVLAVIPRLLLLLLIPIVLSFQKGIVTLPFSEPGPDPALLSLSVQDLVVLLGGLFLLYKATHEIHEKLEGDEASEADAGGATTSFAGVMTQIMVLNIVFSLDSIVTAIGMVPREQILVMMIAVIAATGIMAASVNPVSAFVERHPTVKMLALSFLLLIGMTLLIEAFHIHIPKGYVYFAMGFSVFVEVLNLRLKRKSRPVTLHQSRMRSKQ